MNNPISPEDNPDVITIVIDPVKHPHAHARKMKELMDEGMGYEEARDFIVQGIEMELIYLIGQGLMMVESEAVDALSEIHNPYGGTSIPTEE